MNFYPTPSYVVDLLRKHIPKRKVTNVLEPAVGEGALLSVINEDICKLTLIDVDEKRLNSLSVKYKSHCLINADFITWSENSSKQFDLVITNPPFSARSESWISFENSRVPVELAFILRSISLLRKGGTLICIVPDSVINSDRFIEYRKKIVEISKVNYVYQLPQRLFSKTEGGFFLMIMQKKGPTKSVKLRDATLAFDGEISVSIDKLMKNSYRFDFNFYKGMDAISRVCKAKATCPKNEQDCFIEARRGSIREDYLNPEYHHSNSYREGYWRGFSSNKLTLDRNSCVVVKRVSRDAHASFGLFDLNKIDRATDCLIILRKGSVSPIKLLFFLRVFYANDYGKSILLKGSGAKFISVNQLKSIAYIDLSQSYATEFNLYCEAYFSRNFSKCLQIENYLFNKLLSGKIIYKISRSLESDAEIEYANAV